MTEKKEPHFVSITITRKDVMLLIKLAEKALKKARATARRDPWKPDYGTHDVTGLYIQRLERILNALAGQAGEPRK